MANCHPIKARHNPSPAALVQWLCEAGLDVLHIEQPTEDALRIHLHCHDVELDGVWIETPFAVQLSAVSVVRVYHGEPFGVGMVSPTWAYLLDEAREATKTPGWQRCIAS